MTEQAYVGVKEAASIIGNDEKTVLRRCVSGDIPSLKIGKRYRIPLSWLERRGATPSKITAAELEQATKPPEPAPDPGVAEAVPAQKPAAAAPVATVNKPQGDKMHVKRKPEYDIESKIRRPRNLDRKPDKGPGAHKPAGPAQPAAPAGPAAPASEERCGFLGF